MSYRSDHEAALMRVDALEAELRRLRKGAPPPPQPQPPAKPLPWGRIALAAFAVAFVAGIGKLAQASIESTPGPLETEPFRAPPVSAKQTASLRDLRACIADIAPVNEIVDETTTDPRGGVSPVSWIARTGAACRSDIPIAAASFSDDVRDPITRWGAAEDVLAGTISLIVVYYGNDPYKLDNYATGARLWHEYHQARLARNSVLRDVALVLDRD